MGDLTSAMHAIWHRYIDVLKINGLTGQIKVIKSSGLFDKYTNIFEYIEKTNLFNDIFEDDLIRFREFISKHNLSYLSSISNTVDFSYRKKTSTGLITIALELIRDDSYSLEDPFLILTRKISNENIALELNTLPQIAYDFHKIIRINLLSDTYSIIKSKNSITYKTREARKSLSALLEEFINDRNIDSSDIEIFKKFTDPEYMRRFFLEKRGNLRIRYKSKIDEEFRWVLFEAVPCADFSLTKQNVTIFIRDITDEYSDEIKYKEEIEKICYEDLLTGLQNRNSYIKICNELNNKKHGNCGLIFADLNGLKTVNDSKGHEAGDRYIISFAEILKKHFRSDNCFRIGGDEFIVILQNIDELKFATRAENFRQSVLERKDTSASVGYSWTEFPSHLKEVSTKAERAMYAVKNEYHRLHPETIRILESV